MKNACAVLGLALILALGSGCATIKQANIPQVLDNNLPAITMGVQFATTAAFDHLIAADQRANDAAMAYGIIDTLRALEGQTTPTPAEFQAKLTAWGAPGSIPLQTIVTVLSDAYKSAYPNMGGNVKVTMDVIEAIAKGGEQALKKYLPAS